jgi:branched-chain amino acid transport system ATP-binding protein
VSVAAATNAASAEPILRLRGVGRRFGGLQAVRDVDLDVRRGERRAILGPNGAGKTTLFNVVAGEFPPTSGSIELFGQDVTYLPARTRVGLGLTRTYQTSRLFLGLSVEDNLYLSVVGVEGGHLRPVLRPGRDGGLRTKAREVAERVGLSAERSTLVRNLSHGEQRQLEVGMALAGAPRIMMLDEPAAGLSRAERGKLSEMLVALERDVTLLLIEHDMDVALTVAEYVTMMHDGSVIVEGTPAEIRANQLVHDLYLGRGHYGDE